MAFCVTSCLTDNQTSSVLTPKITFYLYTNCPHLFSPPLFSLCFRIFFGHINYNVLLTQYTCICSDWWCNQCNVIVGAILRLNVDLLANLDELRKEYCMRLRLHDYQRTTCILFERRYDVQYGQYGQYQKRLDFYYLFQYSQCCHELFVAMPVYSHSPCTLIDDLTKT